MPSCAAVTRARPGLLALAFVLTAWFTVGFVQARGTDAAGRLVGRLSALSPAESRRAAGLLATAGTLNPDRQVDILRAELALHHRADREAARILQSVVRDEPDNVAAWHLLGSALRTIDPAAARAADARVRFLVPPVPRP
jgi:hypothetical protein